MALFLTGAIQAPSTSQLPNTFSVMRSVQPLFPAPQATSSYPLGNDLWLGAMGSADLHMQNWSISLTSTTSVTGGGGTQAIAVGTPLVCPSTNTLSASCQSSASFTYAATGYLCTPNGVGACSLVVDPDTANAETLGPSSWSITDGTHLSITPLNSHTQPFAVRQIGGAWLDTRAVYVNKGDTSGKNLTFYDRNNSPILTLPNDTSAAWPTSGISLNAYLTGNFNVNRDLLIRNALSTSVTYWQNAAGTANIVYIYEAGGAGVLKLGSASNTSLQLQGSSDIGRIYGGGTANGLIIYPGDVTHDGLLMVRDHLENNYVQVNTSTGEVDVGTATTTKPVKIAQGSGAFVGSCTMSVASTCTATVPSGAKCVAATTSGVQVLKSVAVSGTTATVTATASGSDTWNIICL